MSEQATTTRDDFFDSLLGDFLDESGQLLDRLNENLLRLDDWSRNRENPAEQCCDAELLNDLFRSAHSLKGLSAMLGLSDINHLTHKVENIFDAARRNDLPINGDVVELVFRAIDRLVALVDALKDPAAEPIECESVLENIQSLLQSAGVARQQTSQADAERALQELGNTQLDATSPALPATASSAAAGEQQPPSAAPAQASSAQALASPPQALTDYFAGLDDETESPSKYLPIFIDETGLSLDQMNETLLAPEGGSPSETLATLLITAHKIKGSAASVGLNRCAKLAHLMEDLLQNLVDHRRGLTPRITDLLLLCVDALRQYVEGLKQGCPQTGQFNQLAHALLAVLTEEIPSHDPAEHAPPQPAATPSAPLAGAGAAVPSAAALPQELHARVSVLSSDAEATVFGRATFQPDLPLVGLKAQLIYEKLANLGEVCYFDPPATGLDEVHELDSVSFAVMTDRSAAEVRSKLQVAGVAQLAVEPLIAAPPTAPATAVAAAVPERPGDVTVSRTSPPERDREPLQAAPASDAAMSTAAAAKSRPAESGSKPAETLRVDIERLDQLMNLAGQLVINKARFARIGERLKSAVASKRSVQALADVFAGLKKMTAGGHSQSGESGLRTELECLRGQARRMQADLEAIRHDVEVLAQVRACANDLGETIHQLDRVADGIQQVVIDTRMLPIGPLFSRFKRVIRDITRSNGKAINLVINGEKTELDKRMIDELSDPLIHMVRNAADHGIESPEVRKAAGKPPLGTVTLDAFHRGNSIIIQVTDDGKGLDADRIAQKALEKGLVTPADLEKMTRQQIYQLIWEPGLSTAEKVTEVSGRGVGMDIVRSKIADLNGVVELDSELGRGTKLTIKLPLTLAILPSLMIDIDGDVFAMPLEAVVEIVRAGKHDLTTVHGQKAARVRGRVISSVTLDSIFTFAGSQAAGGRQTAEETTLVVIGSNGCEIGLAVDCVLGEEDIVIKSMAENYRNVPGIAGASILGDGRVSLILDPAALIDMASNKSPGSAIP